MSPSTVWKNNKYFVKGVIKWTIIYQREREKERECAVKNLQTNSSLNKIEGRNKGV